MSDVRAQAQEVFRQVFDDPEIVLRDEMTADDIPGWDSLTHINLMVATEKRFKIKFATAEISRLKEDGQNVGTFLALIEQEARADGMNSSAIDFNVSGDRVHRGRAGWRRRSSSGCPRRGCGSPSGPAATCSSLWLRVAQCGRRLRRRWRSSCGSGYLVARVLRSGRRGWLLSGYLVAAGRGLPGA